MAFVAAGTVLNVQDANPSVNIPSHSSGDTLILWVAITQGTTSPASPVDTPLGWTVRGQDSPDNGASEVGLAVFTKFGDGAEVSVSISAMGGLGTPRFIAQVQAFSGRGFIETVAFTVQNSGVDIDSPSITPTTNNADISRAFAWDDDVPTEADHDSDGNFKGNSTGYGEANTPGLMTSAWSEQANVAQSATGTSTWSSNADSDSGVAGTVALLLLGTDPFIDIISDANEIDDKQTGVDIVGANFEASQGTGKVEISDNATYGSGNVVEQTVTFWAAGLITITAVLGAMDPGTPRYVWVTNDSSDRNPVGFEILLHRAHVLVMSDSANISASGSNTTAQLTAPTSGTFGLGRIVDNQNPSDVGRVLSADQFREDEFCFEGTLEASDQYEFRISLFVDVAGAPAGLGSPADFIEETALLSFLGQDLVKIVDETVEIAETTPRARVMVRVFDETVELNDKVPIRSMIMVRAVDETVEIAETTDSALAVPGTVSGFQFPLRGIY